MMKKVWLGLALTLAWGFGEVAQGQTNSPFRPDAAAEHWVDSVYRTLSETERIGQLFMVAAYSNRDVEHLNYLKTLVSKYKIGGLIFFQGGPYRQARMINALQAEADVPLLIGIDGEWGLAMRLDSTLKYPYQMTLGAIQDDQYIYYMGKEIARQAKLVGVHVNFAPVVDVNEEPENPVIGYRSFGEDRENVANKGIAYMRGMQDGGILANAKHFPGHGATSTDSHLTLPVINDSWEELAAVELYPFQKLMEAGLMSTMVAHIHVPTIDARKNRAVTLSSTLVDSLLEGVMGFEGLVFTDALNMKGVSQFYAPGEVDLEAFLAGNDVLLFAEDVPKAIAKIKDALKRNRPRQEMLEKAVRRILYAKYWAGLHDYQPLQMGGLYEQLHTPEAKLIQQRLYEKAMTVVRDRDNLLPIQILDTTNFASITLGAGPGNVFQQTLDKYAQFTHYQLAETPAEVEDYNLMLKRLSAYDHVVVGMHDLSNRPGKRFGVKEEDYLFLTALQKNTKVTLVYFGNPYGLKYFDNIRTVLCAYEDNELTQKIAPQVLFGALEATGRLPVTVSPRLQVGDGLDTERLGRLYYSQPEDVGMNSQILAQIDDLAKLAMDVKAAPGMQILVARKGAIVYEKSFGYYTYDQQVPVTDATLYDIASITKAAATLQAVMFLADREAIALDQKAARYLHDLQGTNKNDLVLRDILLHQAGLTPWIPFWKRTQDAFGLDHRLYNIYPEGEYNRQLTSELYVSAALEDSLWQWTLNSDLRARRRGEPYDYRYSDVGFYILHRMVEEQTSQKIDVFLDQNFYQPLGLSTMGYLPLCRFPESRIAPTEEDNYFRNELVVGRVHDQGAAMYGGIAGHAGLFSNAHDLAVLMQMNLQDGYYGGMRYYSPGLVDRFAKRQADDNRRGLGWDKPADPGDPTPTGELVPMDVYGHTGFTGTAAWVDPKYELVYIFLSNRVYPSADNRKLITYNIRTRIQDVIYSSLVDYVPDEEPEEPK